MLLYKFISDTEMEISVKCLSKKRANGEKKNKRR